MIMKRLIFLSLAAMLLCFTSIYAKQKNDIYTFLAEKINYPTRARLEILQGNSIIVFSVSHGALKNVNVHAELGEGCDIAVLNSLMAYPQIKTFKDGKYALKVEFRLQGANSPVKNELVKMPAGYTTLNSIHVIGYLPTSAQHKSNLPMTDPLIIKGYGAVSKQPLIILDDKIVDKDINELDPNQIASISILKDASAVALYGKAAENGVIIITTKKVTKPTTSEIIGDGGNGTKIILRGKNIPGKSPMYLLNGEIKEEEEIHNLVPADILTVEVRKNASAILEYGPSAANGVILITTKKETLQKTKK